MTTAVAQDPIQDAIDKRRANRQLQAIYLIMQSGNWYTLNELKMALAKPSTTQGISARIRDLRKEKYGGYLVERDELHKGVFAYRLDISKKNPTLVLKEIVAPCKLRVVTVTNNIAEYPDYEQMTLEFPQLVQHIHDSWATFVVARDGEFWKLHEFFDTTSSTDITVPLIQLLDRAHGRR